MTVYRADLLLGRAHAPEFASVNVQMGDLRVVDGHDMVLVHGSYVPASRWHRSRADAMRDAAVQISDVCAAMLLVAARCVDEADRLDPNPVSAAALFPERN